MQDVSEEAAARGVATIGKNLQRAVDNVTSRLQDGLAFLATVGSTAPFVGLFGTVWGIYHALTAIGIAGGGTHAFQHWSAQQIFPTERFRYISELYGYLAKQFTVFGQHIHVGVESGDDAVYLTHALSRYIPHFIGSPGYVYAYAYGFLFALSIFFPFFWMSFAPNWGVSPAQRCAVSDQYSFGTNARTSRSRSTAWTTAPRRPTRPGPRGCT